MAFQTSFDTVSVCTSVTTAQLPLNYSLLLLLGPRGRLPQCLAEVIFTLINPAMALATTHHDNITDVQLVWGSLGLVHKMLMQHDARLEINPNPA